MFSEFCCVGYLGWVGLHKGMFFHFFGLFNLSWRPLEFVSDSFRSEALGVSELLLELHGA